ncbi:efflux RND transporter periplasmic adaptor subunit [Ostreibacterium oceani]|nr:efflux RND transporter periplasmic adaptor subunit [Ostreibacterium oceani]
MASNYMISQKKPPESVAKPAPVIFVDSLPVTLTDNAVTIETQGFVRAKNRAVISAEVSGKIEQIADTLAIGEIAKTGQPLLTIEETNYRAALFAAKAALASAERQYAEERARAKQAERDISRLGITGNELAQRKPQLAQAQADIANAKAQIKLAERNLARTNVTAPFDGVITAKHANLGEIINTGTALAELVDTSTFTATAALNPAQIQHIDGIGSTAKITDTVTGETFNAQIDRIAPAFDAQNRTINVYLDIAAPYANPTPLRLDSFVHMSIAGKRYPDTAWIPNTAIVDNAFVWQIKPDSRIDKVPVRLIFQQSNDTLVAFEAPITRLIALPKDAFSVDLAVVDNNPDSSVDNDNNPDNLQTNSPLPESNRKAPNSEPDSATNSDQPNTPADGQTTHDTQ